ncbi:Putative small multi-drug export protein [uncultured archaeon]|nr:Putative small multi-drug export protein [uncultured archaeon]
MELIIKLLTVFCLGALELWVAIPAGIALNLHPLLAGITAGAGAIVSVIIILMPGKRIRTWLMRNRKNGGMKHSRLYIIWARYGAAGLGLLSPILTGAPLGTALGVALGVPAGRLLLWMSLGIVVWSLLLSFAAILGLAGMGALGN